MSFHFKTIPPSPALWERLEQSEESMCFFSAAWDTYLRRMHRKAFVVEVSDDTAEIGYFIGNRLHLGIRVVSAPAMGTGTYTQGLCMLRPCPPEERVRIYTALVQWLFDTRQAHYVQICDWRLRIDGDDWVDSWHSPCLDKADIHYTRRNTYYLDTRRPVEELWANLSYKSCKYSINKATKLGLRVQIIERAEDIPAFVEQHHSHIQDVLRRKHNTGLPSQHKKYMLALCQSLFPDRVLMIQVVGPDEQGGERSMASAIFALDKGGSTYFSSGSYQRHMHFCPNELMLWEAIKTLHSRGAGDLIFGGVAHYKKKFAPTCTMVPVMIFSRWKALLGVRSGIKHGYVKFIHLLASLKPHRK